MTAQPHLLGHHRSQKIDGRYVPRAAYRIFEGEGKEMADALRIGLIGAGRGRSLSRALGQLVDAKIVALCDSNTERLADIAQMVGVDNVYTDVDAFLNHDMDAVVVATPPHLHAEHSMRALGAGFHVLSEVPAVTSMPDAKRLVEAVRASGRTYMMAENCVFWAFVESWRALMASGNIGEMVYAEAEYIHDLDRLRGEPGARTWRNAFPPIQYCTHSLGPILSLTNDRCVSATGFGTDTRTHAGYEADDLELGVFKTELGALIKILIGFAVKRHPSFHYFSVYGTRGVLETSRESRHSLYFSEGIPNLHRPATLPLDNIHVGLSAGAAVGGHGTAEYVMMDAFVRAVRGEGENPVDVYTALDYSIPGILAHQSRADDGVSISVPDPRSF